MIGHMKVSLKKGMHIGLLDWEGGICEEVS
jgi:hypothetical protein